MNNRDPRTGRFVSTSNTPESHEGKFRTYADELPVDIQGEDPGQLAYGTEERHGPSADDLAQGGQWPSLHPRDPELVSMDEHARTLYGVQGARLRDAARSSAHRWDDPSCWLVGVHAPGEPVTGVREVLRRRARHPGG